MKEDYVHINRPQKAALKTAQSEEITFVLFLEIATFKSMLRLLQQTRPCKQTHTYHPRN